MTLRTIKLSKAVRNRLEAIGASKVIVAEVVTVTRDNAASFAHLGIGFANGSVTVSDPIHPPRSAGRWSARNLDGWEDKRRDMPKETREISRFAPSWRGGGSHLVSRAIETFPIDYYPARMLTVSARVVEALRDGALVRIRIDQPLDRADPAFDRDLQFNLRLLKELTGSSSIFDADLSDEDYAAIQQVDWELLPAGKRDELLARMATSTSSNPERLRVASERLETLTKLGPSELILGKGRFSNYFGGRFGSERVALENLEFGNALYLLEKDWEELSQLSRTKLVKMREPRVTRVPHVRGWQSIVRKVLRSERRV